MTRPSISVEILGCRGSVPVSGKRFCEFGGATSCVRILAGKQEIYLDAGNGILNAMPEEDTELSVLLTHPHVDHLLGLSFFAGMNQKDRRINIYMKKREGLGVAQALRCLYSPPLWPVGIFDYPAAVRIYDSLPLRMDIGGVCVRSMEGNHPGGSSIFRLDYKEKSVVYATDFEHNEKKSAELAEFSRGASLLIYDGQYMDAEYVKAKGYGHSTPFEGARIAEEAGVDRLVIAHHAPDHDDEKLLQMEEETAALFSRSSFARCGEKIEL